MRIEAAPLTRFELPDSLSAVEPPEERGIKRDQVRLLVADGNEIRHRRFADLPDQLTAGDLVVVNTSATLPAAVDGKLADGRPVVVHFATPLEDGTWVLEVRPAVQAHGPVTSLVSGERICLAGTVTASLLTAFPDATRAVDQVVAGNRCWSGHTWGAAPARTAHHLRVHVQAVAAGELPNHLRHPPR